MSDLQDIEPRGSESKESEPAGQEPTGGFRLWMIVPALGAAAVLAVFLLGLNRENPRDLPSTLIDKPAPDFALPDLRPGGPGFETADLKAPGVKVVNIWASWCIPCRAEHPELEKLAATGIPVHGINYKDDPANAQDFLDELGDPFTLIGTDTRGRAGIEWGAYGVPETFVIDGRGHVIYKHIGPIQGSDLETKFAPAIEAAKASGG